MTVHLLRLAVGIDDMDHLLRVQMDYAVDIDGVLHPQIMTKRAPRRDKELLDGGSLYSVIKGRIQLRRPIVQINTVEDGQGHEFCQIVLGTDMYETVALSHRPFQGWRYLEPKDTPPDRGIYRGRDAQDLPSNLENELKDLGIF